MEKKLTRRAFIAGTARSAALASLALPAGLLFKGCARSAELDLVVSGGLVYDGTGGPAFEADIGVKSGLIKVIAKSGSLAGKMMIPAGGLAVCPGFIDVHTHTAEELLVNPRAESSVRQGVTTVVSGNCGESSFPLTDGMAGEAAVDLKERYGLDLAWKDAAGFFRTVAEKGTAVNYASLTGHGRLRACVVGYNDRPASQAELDKMKELLLVSMEQGSLGLSSGLEYSPGSFATTEELIELCRAAAGRGGLYATHVRDEEEGVLEAFDEAVRIARESGIRLQVSHLKVGYPRNWPKFEDLMDRFDRAAGSGLDIQADRYPYVAWATGLSLFFPLWSREGRTEDFIKRLLEPGLQERLKEEVLRKGEELEGWDKVLISSVELEKDRAFEGMSVEDAARSLRSGQYEFMRDLLIAENGRVGMIAFGMSEDHLKRILAHPLVSVGSDSSALAPYGSLGRGKPHPRAYGTFPRVLGRYVREEKVLPLQAMIKKMTLMPARHLGLAGRGCVRAGWAADLAVFDPGKIRDLATWTSPHTYPEGVACVIVNGLPVVQGGEHTGLLPGRVLKKKAGGEVL